MAHDMGLAPLIICPKIVVSNWRRVCKELGVEPLDVLNPEKLKTGKTRWLKKHSAKKFEWNIPGRDKAIVFFDEAHGYGAPDSQNAYIMAYTKSYGVKVHMMSATLAESPLRLRAPGYLLDRHAFHDFYPWALRHGCYKNPWRGFEFSKGEKGQDALRRIHKELFPEYGVRVSIADLPDFPATLIQPEAYDLEEIAEVNAAYEEVETAGATPDSPNALVAMLRARQTTELLKCNLVFELAQEQLEEGRSVVIFTNFRPTIERLEAKFQSAGVSVVVVQGGQTDTERNAGLDAFQHNRVPVCLANIKAGGLGVDLHDLYGRPRTSIIFPPLEAEKLKQALGRVRRSGALSTSIQKIVFAAGSVEEDVCNIVKRKLGNLDLLNDGNLMGGVFD